MKKIIAILLAGMMTATALAGCGGSTSESSNKDSGSSNQESSSTAELKNGVADVADFGDEDDITLKVWAPDAAVAITKKQCDAFKALYPEKKITINVVAQSESQAGTQAQTDANAAADVFGFASDQLDNLVATKIIAECAYTEEVTAANTPESVEAGIVDGKLYYYPETTNGYFLSYDNTVVSEEQAKTFEGVLKACKDAGKQFIMDAGNGFYSCIFTFTGGCKIDGWEEGSTDVQKFTEYDEAKAVATLQAFSKLFKDYKGTFQSLSVDKIPSGFANGTLGAGIDGSWDTAVIKEKLGDKYGAAKLPTINVNGEDLQCVSLYGYKALAVNAASKFPRASQILAYYLSGEECQKQRAEEIAWGPTNKVICDSDLIKNSPDLLASSEQAKYAVPQVHIGNFWDPMAALGNYLIKDETDPSDADAFKDLLSKTVVQIKDE
jgi:arabinogalactan oligomer/maltooligosaccharide transport system substrate-binding protein